MKCCFVILTSDQIAGFDFSKVMQKRAFVWNNDFTKTFVKFCHTKIPPGLEDVKHLSLSEMKEELKKPEWQHPEP